MFYRIVNRLLTNKATRFKKNDFIKSTFSIIPYNPPKDNKLIKVQMSESHKPFHYIIDKNDCNLKTINNKKI